jgi:hypothetical protein
MVAAVITNSEMNETCVGVRLQSRRCLDFSDKDCTGTLI